MARKGAYGGRKKKKQEFQDYPAKLQFFNDDGSLHREYTVTHEQFLTTEMGIVTYQLAYREGKEHKMISADGYIVCHIKNRKMIYPVVPKITDPALSAVSEEVALATYARLDRLKQEGKLEVTPEEHAAMKARVEQIIREGKLEV